MTDDHIKADISLYLAGSLTESRNRQIEAHAAACEKCHNALSKARAKQSRIKREALKKAAADPHPNLFLARQGREAGASRPPFKFPWMAFGLVLLAGGGYLVYRNVSWPVRRQVQTIVEAPTPAVHAGSIAVVSPIDAAPVSPAPPAPPKPVPIIAIQQEWQGLDSAIKDFRMVVIRNKEAWDRLRGEMQNSVPEVDFSQHVVVGVFAGERPAGAAVAFGKIKELESEVYVPFRVNLLEVQISTVTTPAAAPSHPYMLAVLPRLEKKIRLTQKEAGL